MCASSDYVYQRQLQLSACEVCIRTLNGNEGRLMSADDSICTLASETDCRYEVPSVARKVT